MSRLGSGRLQGADRSLPIHALSDSERCRLPPNLYMALHLSPFRTAHFKQNLPSQSANPSRLCTLQLAIRPLRHLNLIPTQLELQFFGIQQFQHRPKPPHYHQRTPLPIQLPPPLSPEIQNASVMSCGAWPESLQLPRSFTLRKRKLDPPLNNRESTRGGRQHHLQTRHSTFSSPHNQQEIHLTDRHPVASRLSHRSVQKLTLSPRFSAREQHPSCSYPCVRSSGDPHAQAHQCLSPSCIRTQKASDLVVSKLRMLDRGLVDQRSAFRSIETPKPICGAPSCFFSSSSIVVVLPSTGIVHAPLVFKAIKVVSAQRYKHNFYFCLLQRSTICLSSVPKTMEMIKH